MRTITAARAIAAGVVVLLVPVSAGGGPAHARGSTEVTVGSNDELFSQNKQNEPGLAVNPVQPDILAAGANDNIDLEACNAGDDRTCPFTPGVGVSGVQFSTDSGRTWTQPTYTGYSARETPSCLGQPDLAPGQPPAADTGCVPDPAGPIGTLPNYFENGLVSNGDPELVFGPVPDADGDFSWDERPAPVLREHRDQLPRREPASPAAAIAVSRTDDIAGAIAGDNDAWMDPVIVTRQNSGTVQRQGADLGRQRRVEPALRQRLRLQRRLPRHRRLGAGAVRPVDRRRRHLAHPPAHAPPPTTARPAAGRAARSAPTAPASSTWSGSAPTSRPARACSSRPARSTAAPTSSARGRSCSRSPASGSSTRRRAGSPSTASPAPAPTPSRASTSPTARRPARTPPTRSSSPGPTTAPARTRSGPSSSPRPTAATPTRRRSTPTTATDRANFPAIAISPDGTDAWLVYNAWLDPWRNDTTSPRRVLGVVRHADVNAATGAIGAWTTVLRGAVGDGRASSANGLTSEFLGDYNYAVATRDFGSAVWNDMRNGAVCPAINAYRQAFVEDVPRRRRRADRRRPAAGPGGGRRAPGRALRRPAARAQQRVPGDLRELRHLRRDLQRRHLNSEVAINDQKKNDENR